MPRKRVDPDRSALWLDTVDQGCSTQIREMTTCEAQPDSRSSSKTRKMASATSVSGESSVLHARSKAQLETALAAFGEKKSTEVTMLQESLKLAQRAAQERPVGVQLAQCEQFVFLAQKRLDSLDEERAKLVSELEEGQARLQRLRVQVSQKPQEPTSNRASIGQPSFNGCNLSWHRCSKREFNSVRSKRGSSWVQDKRRKSSRIIGGRSTLSGTSGILSLPREEGRGGCEFNLFRPNGHFDRRRGVEATLDGSLPYQWMIGVVRGVRYSLRGVRVGEASHPGPPENFQRLRWASSTRPGETFGDSGDDVPLVCSPREALGVQGMPITVGGRFASLVEEGEEDVDSGQLPPSRSSSTTVKNPGPRRRRRRLRSEGSDRGCPGGVGAAIHHDLTLIDSSDDDAPFTVPAAPRARPSRRLVLVPASVDATPQSIQDREWIAEHATGPDSPETILDALEEDLEPQTPQLLVVSGSQGQGTTVETDFPRRRMEHNSQCPAKFHCIHIHTATLLS